MGAMRLLSAIDRSLRRVKRLFRDVEAHPGNVTGSTNSGNAFDADSGAVQPVVLASVVAPIEPVGHGRDAVVARRSAIGDAKGIGERAGIRHRGQLSELDMR